MVSGGHTPPDGNETQGGSVAPGPRCAGSGRRVAPLPVPAPEPIGAPNGRQRDILRPVETIFSVLQVIIAVVLIFLVLMHSGKDSGLSGAFGVGSGTGPLGGGSLVERNLNRWTIFFGVLFFLNAFLLLKQPWS